MTKHYVDNKKLYTEMIKYHNEYKRSKELGTEPPRVNEYIGECIWLIAHRVATSKNFVGYSYKEEMIGDAIENCLRYIHNFDPDKSQNPFAYFTQIMSFAFIRRIDKEKKQQYIKYRAMENSVVLNQLVELPPDDQSHFQATLAAMDMDKLSTLSEKYGSKATKKAPKKRGLENFIGDD